jgi:3-isopropylmalate dehydrogenase
VSAVFKLAVLPGDGIGPEVIEAALTVFKELADKFQIKIALNYGLIGASALRESGCPLPAETLALAQASDAVLLGAVGHPEFDQIEPHLRPEQGLLQIRKGLGLFANLRPVKIFESMKNASTLKPEILTDIDMLVVRELTGGLYFGEPKWIAEDRQSALDSMVYQRYEIERIARLAFTLAMQRRKKVTSVDKANVLATSRLWREVVEAVHQDFPEVTLEHQYVDNAAMQLITRPNQYDVMLTENTFGDILSDEASMLTGSLGMLPSASLGEGGIALYEPSHGSAPDIAGQDKANPIATLLSLHAMLEMSLKQPDAAATLMRAIELTLNQNIRTPDIAQADSTVVGTRAIAEAIIKHL